MENDFKKDEIEYKGSFVQYSKENDDKYTILRVISTDPKMYLRKEFEPGREIKEDIKHDIFRNKLDQF